MLNLRLQCIQIPFAVAILINQALSPCYTCADCFENRSVSIQRWLLRHIHNAHAALHIQITVIRFFEPGDDFEHGRFACAVAANQADAFAGL